MTNSKPKNYSSKPSAVEMLMRCGGMSKVAAMSFISNLAGNEKEQIESCANEDGAIDVVKLTNVKNGIAQRIMDEQKANIVEDDFETEDANGDSTTNESDG